MTRRISLLGNGGWGTATALVLLENSHRVTLWGHDPVYTERLGRERENSRYLPGVPLPAELEITTSPEQVMRDAELVVSAVPTRHLAEVLDRFKGLVPKGVPVVSLTKGILEQGLKRPSQIIREILPGHPVAVLGGPSHAEEVALRVPASVVVAAASRNLAEKLQETFSTERFRVYTNSDPLGVELAGALKNVMAIAAGISDGLGFGDNTKAALMTRGLLEMMRLAKGLGARKMTFTGLAGLGDLITTSFSRHGRNRAVGEKLGRGIPLERILRETRMVAEGVHTTRSVMKLAQREQVEMPISHEVHEVLFRDKDPARALHDLMTRAQKSEEW